jgi:hypothetical protein
MAWQLFKMQGTASHKLSRNITRINRKKDVSQVIEGMRNNHMEKKQQQHHNYSKRNVEAAKYKEGRLRTNKKHWWNHWNL